MALKGKTPEERTWNYLIGKICNAYGVAGVMGNLKAESGLIFNRVEILCLTRLKQNGQTYTDESYTKAVDNGTITRAQFLNPLPGKQYGFGLYQITSPGRKAGLYDLCKSRGVSIADEQASLDYLMTELQTSYSSTLSVLKNAKSVKEASDVFLKRFECPADTKAAVQNTRAKYGQEYYDKYAKKNVVTGGASMSYDISKVIAVAENEIGYLEKKSNSNLDNKTANAGSNNYTKYWRDMANLGLGNYQAQYWCACFVHWCFYKAYGLKASQSLLLQSFYINCQVMYNLASGKNQIYSTPKIGDVVLFWTSRTGQYGHTGIVVSVIQDGKSFTTIEGNTSGGSTVVANGGCVAKKTYALSSLANPKFMRPNYGTNSSSIASNSTNLSESTKWTGKITAAANVRTWAGTNYPECSFSPLKSGSKVHVCDTVKASKGADWYYILYDGKYGFVHSKYVSKDTLSQPPEYKYMVKVTASALNIRYGAGTNYPIVGCIKDHGIYTITDEKDGWGKLLSGAGWICLEYTERV